MAGRLLLVTLAWMVVGPIAWAGDIHPEARGLIDSCWAASADDLDRGGLVGQINGRSKAARCLEEAVVAEALRLDVTGGELKFRQRLQESRNAIEDLVDSFYLDSAPCRDACGGRAAVVVWEPYLDFLEATLNRMARWNSAADAPLLMPSAEVE
jgi:hypothetical protein